MLLNDAFVLQPLARPHIHQPARPPAAPEQMVQMAGGDGGAGGSGAPQWAESVLLKSVTTSGYSASAHAAVELEGLLEELRENIRQERDMAGEMMQVGTVGVVLCVCGVGGGGWQIKQTIPGRIGTWQAS